jgi:4-hydroxy-tetrahydrodipicolinate reductase
VKIALNGRGGKVGSAVSPALEAAGHELVDLKEAEAMVDFTAPEVVVDNVKAALEVGIPAVVGTTGWEPQAFDEFAKERGVQLFVAPNFAIGAVLMMRLAEDAARYLPRTEIVELHAETKKDAPSGTAKATAELLGGAPIHSVRLPGLVAHQEVLLGGEGQLLTIRHDAYSREAYVPGVLLALERLSSLPPGLTVGLEALLD